MEKSKTKSAVLAGYEKDNVLAESLGIGVPALRALRRKGLPSVRIGKTVLIPVDAARDWLRKNTGASAA